MRQQRMGLIQTDDQLRFALTAISEGAEDVLKKAKAVKKTNDLISSSSDVINVPAVCNNPSPTQLRHVSPTCIRDGDDTIIENGVIKSRQDRLDGKISPNMVSTEGVRGNTSNGKTRNKDGILTSNFARKRLIHLS